MIGIVLRLFAALRAFVGIHNMSADMELCRRVDKFVIRLFLTYLLHFRTAVIADRMLFLMLDYLEIVPKSIYAVGAGQMETDL